MLLKIFSWLVVSGISLPTVWMSTDILISRLILRLRTNKTLRHAQFISYFFIILLANHFNLQCDISGKFNFWKFLHTYLPDHVLKHIENYTNGIRPVRVLSCKSIRVLVEQIRYILFLFVYTFYIILYILNFRVLFALFLCLWFFLTHQIINILSSF